jgi:hypothetical protein
LTIAGIVDFRLPIADWTEPAGPLFQLPIDNRQFPQLSVPERSFQSTIATADRVLVHVDTEQAHDQLVNSRLADVSVSRGRYDAQS